MLRSFLAQQKQAQDSFAIPSADNVVGLTPGTLAKETHISLMLHTAKLRLS
jgi:hypothetical protein